MELERQFTEPGLAALYDGLCGTEGRDDFGFYLPMIMESASVLDVGCGTGALLHIARDAGHRGRLVGLDPAAGMIEIARRRTNIEWVHAYPTDVGFADEFDLVVMTGHAFQQLVPDETIHATLDAIHRSLLPHGRLAFETRNPSVRDWERWTPADHHLDFTSDDGETAWFEAHAEPIDGDVVRFEATYGGNGWRESSTSTLRFLDAEALDRVLVAAGFEVDARFGDWDRSELTATSPEIITIAARSDTRDDARDATE